MHPSADPHQLIVASRAMTELVARLKATDPVGFAQTIAISLNAHARIGEGEVRLTR